MDAVEVIARFSPDGKITPVSFIWRGNNYQVASVGRSWSDSAGQHVLVMIPGDQIYELIFVPESLGWYLRRLDGGRSAA